MRKVLFGWMCLMGIGAWILGVLPGCRNVATPTFPATDTPTFSPTVFLTYTSTNTPTQTNTRTSTGTVTNTRTATLSPTATITLTPTLTPTIGSPTPTFTNTYSPTFTNTLTYTITNTPTNTPGGPTPTDTATSTPCTAPSPQATYSFEGSTECWRADAGTTIVQNIAPSTTQAHDGTYSLAVSVNNSSAVSQNAQVEVVFSSPQNMANAIITMWVYVDSSLKTLPDWNTAVQPFAQDPWAANWIAVGPQVPVTTWTSIAVTLGSGATTISQMGLQLTTVGPGASGNIYIDGVTVNLAPAATPTFTATATPVQTWDFESGTAQGWVTGGGNVAGTTFAIAGPGWNASSFCFDMTAPFTAQGQGAGIAQTFGSPLNLSGGGIRCYMWLDSGVSDGYPGGQIAPSDGSGTYWGFWGNLTPGTWNFLDCPASTWTGVNAANITQIIIQAAMGGTGTTFATGHVKIDQIEAY